MAKIVTVDEAERRLAELIALASRGEEVVIEQDQQIKVKLVPLPSRMRGRRVFGQHRGQAWISDDFDAPLPDDFWISGKP